VNGSIRIGSVFGITLRLHVLLLIVFGILIVRNESPLVFGILFGCVLLHELGHSLVAMAFGIRVVDITLWPLGGMARMSQIPESTHIEALIAIAGPAVNFLLALLGLLASGSWHYPPSDLFQWFSLVNLSMGLFNLLPAFPMDGGRILRALLGWRGDWLKATERAVWIGRWFAISLCLLGFGLLLLGDPGPLTLVLVGIFIWWSGNAELASVRARHALSSVARAERSGFSAEEIAALERFRGRLSDSHSDER
jgi:Zn-dependent protease